MSGALNRVLLLGGTGEARAIARDLPVPHIYSLAGLGQVPDNLNCCVRVGGFGGAAGLAKFVMGEGIGLVVDATHPFATQISANARAACAQTHVPLWQLHRGPWVRQEGDDWRFVDDWTQVLTAIAPFARPLFTTGREPLAHLNDIAPHQRWTVRCLDAHPGSDRAEVIDARGPFTLEQERALLTRFGIDVIVSKFSGGAATQAKVDVARERGLPVVMVRRPSIPNGGVVIHAITSAASAPSAPSEGSGMPAAFRTFDDVATLRGALRHALAEPTPATVTAPTPSSHR